ncbi:MULTISPECIES: adenylosuccinate synthetase [unclassified Methanoregula]|uniref:adenylosuccinate synthetase n=1 Tax=unclassified Methanoregula TaxID=2649730 RepID=UPI0009C8A86A|nr:MULTISPECIES: adenylosuccinate synthetase [unclassified Methanoregula]OPX64321.1 MAG: Adenylosuccinate synthetase [Methanoregula sp. PtaB.Bin085]OPY33554.1 MAG: Adenylosuccinate synthetase [Methanoregula sp. PtaU1.Bin006]
MSCTIIVGGFFGDEGKGKVVAHIAYKDKPVIISRGGVGPNAGHTVQVGTKEYGVRMVPSGFVYKDAKLCIGSGVLVDPRVLKHEVDMLGVRGRVFVDKRCGVITEDHIARDKGSDHLAKKIGSTGSGCGPANSDRVMRISPQAKDVPELAEYLMDVPKAIDEELKKDNCVLLEGTQGFGISLYYGTYPFVTSKDTSASQIAADNGVGPTRIDDVVVVFKAYPTRVGEGPFSTEMPSEKSDAMGIQEFGTVTHRKRRIGGWDGGMARYSAMINGCTQAAITGIDRVDKACFGVTDYSKLTKKAKDFLKTAEDDIGCPITLISTGPEITQIIDLREELA